MTRGDLGAASIVGMIATASGRLVKITAPRAEDIEIADIAAALSKQCRWGGHCAAFYSVAQHCVAASYLVDPAVALWALLHDASEAYLVDLPKPIKAAAGFEAYGAIEALWQKTIYVKYGLTGDEPAEIKVADRLCAAAEAIDLFPRKDPRWAARFPDGVARAPHSDPWSPTKARSVFLDRFERLMRAKLAGR